jgi:hypothetical protein
LLTFFTGKVQIATTVVNKIVWVKSGVLGLKVRFTVRWQKVLWAVFGGNFLFEVLRIIGDKIEGLAWTALVIGK